MRNVTLAGIILVTVLSTAWVLVYGLMVAWWRNVYGRMLMLLMVSLSLGMIATLHDFITPQPLDWGPGIGIPLTIALSAALAWSLAVMIRDNFFCRKGTDETATDSALPESRRRCAGCDGDLGPGGER